MLSRYLIWNEPSDKVSVLHGFMAVISLVLLVGLIVEAGLQPVLIGSFGTFALAMMVGFLLIGVNLHGEIIEFRSFVILHVLLSLLGLSLLVFHYLHGF